MRTTLTLLFSLLFVTITGCNGCSNERYYCDDTGCYACDGIGCRNVDPPVKIPCKGDYQCAEGSICTDAGCLPSCADAECPRGLVCNDAKLCVPPGTSPAPVPGACETNADCPAPPAAICLDGKCQIDPVDCGSTGCDCEANSDCADGYVCAGGRCRSEEDSCQFNSDCGPNRVCVDGLCFGQCGGAITCAAGFSCVDGACQPNELPMGECTRNDDCAANEVCLDSSCVPECTTDANCAAGFYCQSGACVVDTRPKPFCSTDAQCASGRSCIDGVCRTPCNTDNQCMMFSGTVPYCRNHVCVTNHEANSQCVTTVDCMGSNVECVDGVCQ